MANAPVTGPSRGPILEFSWVGGSGGDFARPWDLVSVPGASGPPQWRVEVGRILDGTGKVASYLSCTNPEDTFTPAVGGHIVIEFAEPEPTQYEINYYATWPISGGWLVEVDADFAFVRSLVPLYQFIGVEVYGAIPVADGVWAEPVSYRLCQSFFQHATNARVLAPDIVR